jgi:hypothetical protein
MAGLGGVGSLQFTENDVIASATELHRPLEKEVSMVHGRTSAFQAQGGVTDDGPLHFIINSQSDHYIQLQSARLYLKGSVTKINGNALTTNAADPTNNDTVGMINLASNTMFKSIDISINGDLKPDLGTTHYPYKYYLENVLSYSRSSADTHLAASGFFLDTPGKYNSLLGTENSGFKSRQMTNKKFEFYAPIANDFLQSDRLLLPGIKLDVQFHRAPNDFCLMAANGKASSFKIKIEEAKLYVRFIELGSLVKNHHAKLMIKEPAIFPINRTQIITHSFPQGQSHACVQNAFEGTLPKQIIIAMVTQSAFNGKISENPFNFQHFDTNFACIVVNGESVPLDPYTPDFENGYVIREFKDVAENTGIKCTDSSNLMNFLQFKGGMTLFCFDLSPDMCGGFHFRDAKRGNINIDFKFRVPLAHSMQMIISGTFDSYLTIDKHYEIVCKNATY